MSINKDMTLEAVFNNAKQRNSDQLYACIDDLTKEPGYVDSVVVNQLDTIACLYSAGHYDDDEFCEVVIDYLTNVNLEDYE